MPERQINGILDRRLGRGAHAGNGRLQSITRRIEAINLVKERIHELDTLVNTISGQIEAEKGEYYNMLIKDPEALAKFQDLSRHYTNENGRKQFRALAKIEALLKKLELLKLRFSREAIRIAFIGRERQGKSTFIKTITDLNDKVIPAYDGTSCTGAVSVIHNVNEVRDEQGNVQKVKVVVDYYDTNEFLQIVNEKLQFLLPKRNLHIGRLEDIKILPLPEKLDEDEQKLSAQYNKFKTTVVDKFDEYQHLIGVGTQTYYDENVIAQHVAQYERFDDPIPNAERRERNGKVYYELQYYKYVAVKNVNIYTRFIINQLNLLELVDTIGIGSAGDTKAIEDEMYRVLREDCDAAINLFRPLGAAGYGDDQSSLNNNIAENLKGREPWKWITYVINKQEGNGGNVDHVEQIKKQVDDDFRRKEQPPVDGPRIVNGNNFDDVKDNLITPLLQLIAGNLETLDDNLVEQANGITKEAYNECLTLVRAANDVISAGNGLSAEANELFEEKLYDDMLALFTHKMNEIEGKGYAARKEEKCPELFEAYDELIKKLTLKVPGEDKILNSFECGANETPNHIFEVYIEQMRNDIFNEFENVNTTVLYPLQEKVKTDLIEILYNQGKMKCLPTSCDTPSIEWLQSIIDNYVDEATYPHLYKAFKFILDYQINLEGLVEYNIAKSLYIIDRTHNDFMNYSEDYGETFQEKSESVWCALYNRIRPVQQNLRRLMIDEFTLIPSHSFYSRVHKFFAKILTDEGGVKELRRFYRRNMGYIWKDEICEAGQTQRAFGDWTERTNNLREVVTNRTFNI